MKYSKWIGLTACITLSIACFMPWAYYADINKTFTGFFSQNGVYGKPGKFLVFFAVASGILILLPKIWAKRIHLFLSALFTGYAVKSYILFTSCYNTFCPEKQFGIYLMMISCFLILIVAILPDMKISVGKKDH
ncbi:MAG: hypothetical protein ABIN97_19195 [Ginsengibacter sp.]